MGQCECQAVWLVGVGGLRTCAPMHMCRPAREAMCLKADGRSPKYRSGLNLPRRSEKQGSTQVSSRGGGRYAADHGHDAQPWATDVLAY